MERHKKNEKADPYAMTVGFQIAPMIDVVFVIMLFFMVMAGAVKVEREINTNLPGTAESSDVTDIPDEQIIAISEDGQVTLNDEPIGTPAEKKLSELTVRMVSLKKSSEAAKAPLLVTILSDEKAKYARTIDVLDAISPAEIKSVTFTVTEEE